jgi:hypothetical protein
VFFSLTTDDVVVSVCHTFSRLSVFFCFFPEYLVCHTCMELHDDISPSIIQFHLTFTLTEKPLRILGEIQSV